MGQLREFITPLHTATARDYLGRMVDRKPEGMVVARKFEEDYWDGDRRFGYGGYRYIPSWWQPVAEALIETYSLTNESKILDVGCGKAFLLYEIQLLLPGASLVGFDVSRHGLANQHPEFRGKTFEHRAEDPYAFAADEFDLVISAATLHNLRLPALEAALSEIQRVGKRAFVMVEAYRNELELFNLECWALTAEAFLHPEEWLWLFGKCGYSGDYEFIFFE